MIRRFQRLSLERQLFLSFFSLCTVLLLLFTGTTLWLDISRQRQALDSTISNTAAYVASLRPVADMLEQGYPDPQVRQELDAMSRTMSDLDVILVCDASGMRFYHTSRQSGGETELTGDETALLQDRDSYIATGYSTRGEQRRAFHAVYDDQGALVGFVMVSVFTSDILRGSLRLAVYSLVLLCVMLAAALALSHGIVSDRKSVV